METKKYPLIVCRRETESDIIFIEFNKISRIDLDMAKELVNNRQDFTKGKHYLIIDFSKIRYFTPEAKNYMQGPEGTKNILAGAFIARNPIAVLLANIFIKKIKSVPSRFFTSKTAALKWLEELKKD